MPDQSYLGGALTAQRISVCAKIDIQGDKIPHRSMLKFKNNKGYMKFARFVRDKQSN